MHIPAPLISLGKVFGTAAVVGTTVGIATRSVLEHTDGKTHDAASLAVTIGEGAAMMAFWLTPGLPNKPLATGVLMGAIFGLMIGNAGQNDAKAAALAVQPK